MRKKGVKKKVVKKPIKKAIKKKVVKGKPIKKKIVGKKVVKKMVNKKISKKKTIRKKVIKKKMVKKRAKKIVKKRRRKVSRRTILKPNIRPKRGRIIKNFIQDSKGVLRQAKILKKSPRAGTGIPGLDRLIEGGFERNSINLVSGGSGSGKSILAIQFLMEGAREGETTLYVSFEEKKDEFYRNMKKFGWDLQKLENSGKFIFLEYSPEKVKMTLDEGGGTIETLILRHKITRMVIDSVTSFSLLFDDTLSKKQANLALFDIISKWNTTTMMTVQNDPTEGKGEEISTIEFEADSIILLYYLKIKGKRKRFIEILKMRGTNHSKATHAFEISLSGIKIGSEFDIKKTI